MEKGYPAREFAHVLILKNLLRQELGFEELVSRLKGQLSRGSVNKYLNEIWHSKEEFKDFVKRKGRRGKYYIPKEKRADVELFLKREEIKRNYNNIIDIATLEELEELRKNISELKKLVYPVYVKLEAELLRTKHEAEVWRGFLAMLEKGAWKFFAPFWKKETRKLSGAVEKQIAELEPQVAKLRKFFDLEEAQRAIYKVMKEQIMQLAVDTKGRRGQFYADQLAEWEAQEKREQKRG